MIEIREYALRMIAFRDRTEKEIREKLSEKGYDTNEIEDETEFLKNYGYINDRKYAEHFINDSINLRKWGKIRISSELLKRGISRDIFEDMLREAFSEGSTELICKEISVRFKNSDLSNLKERTRIFNFFLRRGYTSEEIKGAMNRVCSFRDIDEECF